MNIDLILPLAPAGAATQRVLFRAEEASSIPFEIQLDDLRVFAPIHADGFESGNTIRWTSTVGGAP